MDDLGELADASIQDVGFIKGSVISVSAEQPVITLGCLACCWLAVENVKQRPIKQCGLHQGLGHLGKRLVLLPCVSCGPLAGLLPCPALKAMLTCLPTLLPFRCGPRRRRWTPWCSWRRRTSGGLVLYILYRKPSLGCSKLMMDAVVLMEEKNIRCVEF